MDIIELLNYVVQQNASDLHISSGEKPYLRIDGDLIPIEDAKPIDEKFIQTTLKTILPEFAYNDLQGNLDTDIAISIDGLPRFRANVFHQFRGGSISIRIFPQEIPTFQQLGLPEEIFSQLCNLPNGLILLTGATGCGKTTTLASMLEYINCHNKSHIITIEDPIEYIHKSKQALIEQREIKLHTKSFSSALRSALREDPDFILIGEMRDLETIRLALTAAETGHLVFATLHTNSTTETINRIIDVFPAAEKDMVRSMLSNTLQAVVSQHLVKKVGGGRTAALEIMLCNTAIRNMIRQDQVHQIYSAIQTGQAAGMQTLEQHLDKLIQSGIIDGKIYSKLLNS